VHRGEEFAIEVVEAFKPIMGSFRISKFEFVFIYKILVYPNFIKAPTFYNQNVHIILFDYEIA
jgi:hypothetical protein